jgi:hypothetical protein
MTMRVSLRRPARLAAPARRHSGRADLRARAQPPAPSSGPDELRARSSGGPEDKALYSCECGCAFQAPVSASVRCPHCGGHQAW